MDEKRRDDEHSPEAPEDELEAELLAREADEGPDEDREVPLDEGGEEAVLDDEPFNPEDG